MSKNVLPKLSLYMYLHVLFVCMSFYNSFGVNIFIYSFRIEEIIK